MQKDCANSVWRKISAASRRDVFDAEMEEGLALVGTGINRQSMGVDIVAESVDGQTLLVGEAKLRLTKLEAEHALSALAG